MWIGFEYSYEWFGYHTARSFWCLCQVNLSTGQCFWQAINVKSLMITDSRASEASRCMFVKPLIIAQFSYPSSNVLVKSTYCKIHDRDWFQPRLDLHDSNAKAASVDWPIERNWITDRCVYLQDLEQVLQSHERKFWQSFQHRSIPTCTSSCWLRSKTADRSTYAVVTAVHSDAAHIEKRRLSPREVGCCLEVFSLILDF